MTKVNVEMVRDLEGGLIAVRRGETVPVPSAESYQHLLPLSEKRKDWGRITVKVLPGCILVTGTPYDRLRPIADREQQILVDLAAVHIEVARRLTELDRLAADLPAVLRIWPDLIVTAARKAAQPLVNEVNSLRREVQGLADEVANQRMALTDHIELPGKSLPPTPGIDLSGIGPDVRAEGNTFRGTVSARQYESLMGLAGAGVAPHGGSRLLSPMFGFAKKLFRR